MIIKPKAQIISVIVRLYFLTISYPVNFSHVAKGYDFDVMKRLTSRRGGKKHLSFFFFFNLFTKFIKQCTLHSQRNLLRV